MDSYLWRAMRRSTYFSGSWFCSLLSCQLLRDISFHGDHLAACPSHWSLSTSAPATSPLPPSAPMSHTEAGGSSEALASQKLLSLTKVLPCQLHHALASTPTILYKNAARDPQFPTTLLSPRLSQSPRWDRLPGQPRLPVPCHRTSKCFSDSKEVLWSNNFRALFTNIFGV